MFSLRKIKKSDEEGVFFREKERFHLFKFVIGKFCENEGKPSGSLLLVKI